MRYSFVALTALAVVTASISPSLGQNPSLINLNIFRDFRGINDVGVVSGDEFQYGADVVGGSNGVTIQGIFNSNVQGGSFTTSVVPCGNFTVNPNFCARSSGFNTARLNGTWQAKFTNASGSTTVTLPSVSVIPANPVPFPIDVTISTDVNGTPTLCWALAQGTLANDFRVQIFDKSQLNAQGVANIIESKNIPTTQTCYTPTVTLNVNGNYTINLQVIQTRDGNPIPPNTGNSDILSRSNSYWSFTRPAVNPQPATYLPQVSANGNFNFQVSNVIAGTPILIDPPVAIGYAYSTGPGDPNFATVTLPSTGGGSFVITYTSAGQPVSTPVSAGAQFAFPASGVNAFSVTGIDPNAGIDPGNAGAFVTSVTFVSNGTFTGQMIPLLSGQTLFAATLPTSRSIQVGNTATAFASILNTGAAKTNCGIIPSTFVHATFLFQTTDPNTNKLTGTPNTFVPIAAGASQSYLVAFTANQAMLATNVALGYRCTTNQVSEYVPTIVGVNSLLLTFDNNPVPDLIAVGLTPSNDGFSHTGGSSGTGVFAIASANIGISAQVTARARVSNTSLPLTTFVCQTDPNTGLCMAPPAPTVTTTIGQNQTTTWTALLQASGTIAADAANNRVFFEFVDGGGIVRGSTSTAVTTQ